MENKEFYFQIKGINIHAKLEFPKNAPGPLPLVIVIPGLTGNMEERQILGMAQAVLDAGFASLRIELYGHGLSEGDFHQHTVGIWVEELEEIIDLVKDYDFVTDLYLAGHSQGGLTAALAARNRQECIKSLLLMAPAFVIVDACRKGSFFGAEFDEDHIPDRLEFWETYVEGNYILDAMHQPMDQAIAAYQKPVLIVQGTSDESVPVFYALDASRAYKNSDLVLIPDDDHCYQNHLDVMQKAITDFLGR